MGKKSRMGEKRAVRGEKSEMDEERGIRRGGGKRGRRIP